MRRLSLLVVVAASVLALSAGTLAGRTDRVEGAKPALENVNTTLEVVDGNCVATVTWSGLKGGKVLHVTTWLADPDHSMFPASFSTREARQGDGRIVVNLGIPEANVGFFALTIDDNRFNSLSPLTYWPAATCT
jgi:hypothetical protein